MTRLPLIVPLVVVLAAASVARDAEAGARRSRPLETGQTTCWDAAGDEIDCAGTGQDGELQRGEPRAYLDLGNGAIKDQRTALMWEKLSDDDSVHDKDNTYTWDEAFAKIDDLNAATFAGFTDWRLPSAFELFSLVKLDSLISMISPPFDTGCAAGCTVLTCSCTASQLYWSSSTLGAFPAGAMVVDFQRGTVIAPVKSSAGYVRAVRSGS